MSRDIIWQPGHVAEESVTVTADGLGDGREISGHGDRVIADKLVPVDLQQLSLALHMESPLLTYYLSNVTCVSSDVIYILLSKPTHERLWVDSITEPA